MSLPEPAAGLVIRYAFLWSHEADAGQTEGLKDRPSAIILAKHAADDGIAVTVARITHSEPRDGHSLVLPMSTKRRLGLDGERSWIAFGELNRFIWPGPDLRAIRPGGDQYAYGFLPPAYFDALKKAIIEHWEAVRVTGRTE